MDARGKVTSVSKRVSVISFVMLVVVAIVVCALGIVFYYNDSMQYNQNAVHGIAQTLAAAVDGDTYEQITLEGPKNAEYDSLQQLFNNTKTNIGDLKYVYALNNDVDGKAMFVVEGFTSTDDMELILEYGEVLPEGSFDPLMFEALSTGQPYVSSPHEAEGFGSMITGYAPIKNSTGKVVGVLGADLDVSAVTAALWSFGLRLFVPVIAIALVFGLLLARMLRRTIGNPLKEVAEAADKIAVGDLEVDLEIKRNDEIGRLCASFQNMVQSTSEQIEIMERISGGDLVVEVPIRSDKDAMNQAIKEMTDNLNAVIQKIRTASMQVASEAEQIASGAQALANGSTEQSATLQSLSNTINDIHNQAIQNVELASETMQSMSGSGELMEECAGYMDSMNSAMQTIEESSQSISDVIKVIDDIAFQTNILALNAAVEAARAGEHGKGFAVVSDEVRTLANKSADAAKDTTQMIQQSIEHVQEGSGIARKTNESLSHVSETIVVNTTAVNQMSEASQRQSTAITHINQSIAEISHGVQENSATAQQSAALSEELSAQSSILKEAVSQFTTRDASTIRSAPISQDLLPVSQVV